MSWEFITIRHVRAAKPHTCAECVAPIVRGQLHAYTAGKVEGYFEDYRMCEPCFELAQAFSTEFWADEGFPLGSIRQTLAEDHDVHDADAWLIALKSCRAAERAKRDAPPWLAEDLAAMLAARPESLALNPWRPMSRPIDIKVVGKGLEELGEGVAAWARCLIQGIDEVEPVTKKPNRQWAEEEIADILANLGLMVRHFGMDLERIEARARRKAGALRTWHAMLDELDKPPAADVAPHLGCDP